MVPISDLPERKTWSRGGGPSGEVLVPFAGRPSGKSLHLSGVSLCFSSVKMVSRPTGQPRCLRAVTSTKGGPCFLVSRLSRNQMMIGTPQARSQDSWEEEGDGRTRV